MTMIQSSPTMPNKPREFKRTGRTPPVVALPEPGLSLDQDEEWCVYQTSGGWQEIRFHDYAEVYDVPGLYEHLFYDILQCDSPATIRRLLHEQLREADVRPENLRVLDLGAGNGMVGEELRRIGVQTIVGVDIIDAARRALDRDRPGLYRDYFVADMKKLDPRQRERILGYRFNALTCVAALGFGDIPPDAFAAAFRLLGTGAWTAFNIKAEFLDGRDSSGFSRLIDKLVRDGTLKVRARKHYRHRLATNGESLYYVAMVGTKERDLPDQSAT